MASAFALAACGGGHHAGAGHRAAPGAASPAASPAPGSAAAVLARAAGVMSGLESYSFTIAGSTGSTQLIGQGRVAGNRLLATFTAGGRSIAVLSAAGHGYVQQAGGHWQADPGLQVHPVPWNLLLRAVTRPTRFPPTSGERVLGGSLDRSGLAAVGAPSGSGSGGSIKLYLDSSDRVVALVVKSNAPASGKGTAFTERLSFAQFDASPAVPAGPPRGS